MSQQIASRIDYILERRKNRADILRQKRQELVKLNQLLTESVSEPQKKSVQHEINDLMTQLNQAISRFGRGSINIAVAGRDCQGRSCFVQSVGNLDHSIMPENERADLTDSIFVVQNCLDMKPGAVNVTITFRTKDMLLDMVKQYLNFIDPEYLTGKSLAFEEIPAIDCRALDLKITREKQKNPVKVKMLEHLSAIVNHFYDTYEDTYGVKASISSLCGGPPVTLTDPNIIRIFTQQNNSSILDGKEKEFLFLSPLPESVYRQFERKWGNYYLYPAVARVDIHCRFPADYGRLALIETKGISDTYIFAADTMLDIIAHEADAVVVITCPDSNFREEDRELYNLLRNRLGERELDKWLFYLINHHRGKNDQAVKAFSRELRKRRFDMAFSKIIDCSDQNAVREQFLEPVLDKLISNLDEADSIILGELEKKADKVTGLIKKVLDELDVSDTSDVNPGKKRRIIVPAAVAVLVVGIAAGSFLLGNNLHTSQPALPVSKAELSSEESSSAEFTENSAYSTSWKDSAIIESYLEGTAGTNSNEGPENLFDNNEQTKWCVTGFSEAYVIFRVLPVSHISGYRLTTGNDNSLYPGRNPKAFTLYGWDSSDEPEHWIQISHVSDSKMEDENYTEYYFSIENSNQNDRYEYYMLVIEEIQSGSTMQMSEFKVEF